MKYYIVDLLGIQRLHLQDRLRLITLVAGFSEHCPDSSHVVGWLLTICQWIADVDRALMLPHDMRFSSREKVVQLVLGDIAESEAYLANNQDTMLENDVRLLKRVFAKLA